MVSSSALLAHGCSHFAVRSLAIFRPFYGVACVAVPTVPCRRAGSVSSPSKAALMSSRIPARAPCSAISVSSTNRKHCPDARPARRGATLEKYCVKTLRETPTLTSGALRGYNAYRRSGTRVCVPTPWADNRTGKIRTARQRTRDVKHGVSGDRSRPVGVDDPRRGHIGRARPIARPGSARQPVSCRNISRQHGIMPNKGGQGQTRSTIRRKRLPEGRCLKDTRPRTPSPRLPREYI